MNMDDLARDEGAAHISLEALGHQTQLPDIGANTVVTTSLVGRIGDIFNLVSEHSRQMERIMTTLEHQSTVIATLTDKVDRLSQLLLTIKSNTPLDEEKVELVGADDQKTRVVTTEVPYAVIRYLWLQEQGDNKLFPVAIKYLSALCGCCFGHIDPKVKSRLGTSLQIPVQIIISCYS